MRPGPPRRGRREAAAKAPALPAPADLPPGPIAPYPVRMAQPAVRILTPEQAQKAARALQTPSEVRAFISMRSTSSSVREFMATSEWSAIHARIIGDGSLPLDPRSLPELARMARWAADGELGGDISEGGRKAYLHMAEEIELLVRQSQKASPVRAGGLALTAVPDDEARAA